MTDWDDWWGTEDATNDNGEDDNADEETPEEFWQRYFTEDYEEIFEPDYGIEDADGAYVAEAYVVGITIG